MSNPQLGGDDDDDDDDDNNNNNKLQEIYSEAAKNQ
jgi:hypothetical protein